LGVKGQGGTNNRFCRTYTLKRQGRTDEKGVGGGVKGTGGVNLENTRGGGKGRDQQRTGGGLDLLAGTVKRGRAHKGRLSGRSTQNSHQERGRQSQRSRIKGGGTDCVPKRDAHRANGRRGQSARRTPKLGPGDIVAHGRARLKLLSYKGEGKPRKTMSYFRLELSRRNRVEKTREGGGFTAVRTEQPLLVKRATWPRQLNTSP